MKFKSSQIQATIFIVLILAVGALVWVNRSKIHSKKNIVLSQTAPLASSDQPYGSDFPISSVAPGDSIFGKKTLNMPFLLNDPSQGSVLLHYFINGSVKQIKNTAQGAQIILSNADSSYPPFIIAKDTRISKITPPYASNNVPITVSDLKPGNNIIISIEYDLTQQVWLMRDVLLPTDHN